MEMSPRCFYCSLCIDFPDWFSSFASCLNKEFRRCAEKNTARPRRWQNPRKVRADTQTQKMKRWRGRSARWKEKWVVYVTLWWQAVCHQWALRLIPREILTLRQGLSPASPLLWPCSVYVCLCSMCVHLWTCQCFHAVIYVSCLLLVCVRVYVCSWLLAVTQCNSAGLSWSHTDSCELSLRTHGDASFLLLSTLFLSLSLSLSLNLCM